MKAFHTLSAGNYKFSHRGSNIQKDYTYMDQEEQNNLDVIKGVAVQVEKKNWTKYRQVCHNQSERSRNDRFNNGIVGNAGIKSKD